MRVLQTLQMSKQRHWCCKGCAEHYQPLVKVLALQGYRGNLEDDLYEVYDVLLEVVEHQGKGFQVQAKRWIVERTWAWRLECTSVKPRL